MAEVTYVEAEKPLHVAGTDAWCYGYYRVDLGDFVYLSPYVDHYNCPIDEPEHRALLIETAKKLRAKEHAE